MTTNDKSRAAVADNFGAIAESIQQAAESTIEQLGHLRMTLAELERERLALTGSPLPQSAAVANMKRWVSETSARWRADHASSCVAQFATPPNLERADGRARQSMAFSDWCRGDHLTLSTLVGLFPGLVETALAEILEIGYGQPANAPGPSAEIRRTRYAELGAQIAEMERVEEEIIRAARRAGVPLARRPMVQGAILTKVRTLRNAVADLEGSVQRTEHQVRACARTADRAVYQERLAAKRDDLAKARAELAELEAIL